MTRICGADLPEEQARALALLADRQAIATNLARHSRGVDRTDFDLLSSAYWPDAQVSYGMFNGPARDMAAFLTGGMFGQPVTLHRTGNMWIEVDGERARSEGYVIAYMRTSEPDGAQTQRMIGGRYLDRHEKRDGAWKIVHRTYVMEWNVNRPGTEAPPGGSAEPWSRFSPLGGHRGGDPGSALLTLWRARPAAAPSSKETELAQPDLDAVIARDAIHRLAVQYCRGMDRADADLLGSVFHEDAAVVAGVFNGPAPEFARFGADLVRTQLKDVFHSIANEWVEVNGDSAVGEIYVIAFSRSAGESGEQDSMTGGRYLDRYERRNGEWKIAERVFVQDWTMSHPSTREEHGMYAELPTRGGLKPDDPVYAFWSA